MIEQPLSNDNGNQIIESDQLDRPSENQISPKVGPEEPPYNGGVWHATSLVLIAIFGVLPLLLLHINLRQSAADDASGLGSLVGLALLTIILPVVIIGVALGLTGLIGVTSTYRRKTSQKVAVAASIALIVMGGVYFSVGID